jgi:RNA polymerase sigma-70 factor (family 1)
MDITTTDSTLWSRIVRGDEHSFEIFFIRYYSGLIRYAKSLLPYPSDEAEDIITEVFFKIWQQRENLDIHTSIVSYLYISVRSRIYDFYRAKKMSVPIEEAFDQAELPYLVPDHLLVYKELSMEMEYLISLLPKRTRLIYQMNRNDNLTYADIAAILDISVNSVKTHMYRGIRFLKESYHASDKDSKY